MLFILQKAFLRVILQNEMNFYKCLNGPRSRGLASPRINWSHEKIQTKCGSRLRCKIGVPCSGGRSGDGTVTMGTG